MPIFDGYKKSEALAIKLISDYGITSPPVPVDRIAKQLGLSITKDDFEDGISGALVISNNIGSIGVNSKDSSVRRRFTIAHELGHYLLHKNSSKVFLDKDFLVKWRNANNAYTQGEKQQEFEANAFAAALLMPRKFIEEEIKKRESLHLNESTLLEKLAKTFNVSVAAMSYRITNLNSYYF